MQHADKKKQTGSQREQKIKIREGRKINQIKSNRTRHINREPSIIYTHIPSSSCLVFCAYIIVYIIYTRRNGFGAFVCPGHFRKRTMTPVDCLLLVPNNVVFFSILGAQIGTVPTQDFFVFVFYTPKNECWPSDDEEVSDENPAPGLYCPSAACCCCCCCCFWGC